MTTLLAGDIGGTKTILRWIDSVPGREDRRLPHQEVLAERRYSSREFSDLVPMVRRFFASVVEEGGEEPRPEAACFGIAGPVVGNDSELTNLAWSLQGARLERELDVARVRLINDFAAVGYGALALGTDELHVLQEGEADPAAPIAVLGAGTGLGEGFVIPDDEGFRAFATEGGHTDFAPRSALEFQLLSYLQEAHHLTHVSVERVVSGMGIATIYEFLRDRDPERESPELSEVFRCWKTELGREKKSVDLAAEVSRAAIERRDPLAHEAMRLFVEAYGAEAGNLALKVLPYGGLYVAGGIAPKILPLLDDGGFLEAFRAKGRMRPLLERMPVHVVLEPKVGLRGAALRAAQLLA